MKKEYDQVSIPSVPKKNARVVIIQSAWHAEHTDRMVDACRSLLIEAGVPAVEVIQVPGCYEIPLTAKLVAQKGDVDAIVVFGAIVQGDTDHYRLILDTCIRELGRVMYDFNVPVINEILPVQSLEDVIARSQGNSNKGIEAAHAAAAMIGVVQQLRVSR